MKKLLARIKQWNNSNAGLTLVEIIVTMLILVVIALPILGGFIVAARANAMAKDLAYARDAAENVVEVANSAGVSAEVFNAAKWNCTPSPTPNITLAPGVTVTPVPVEEYVVTGIRSGTGTYTAKIICNRTTYQAANKYVLPDMSALDSEKTVVIFPESNFYEFDDEGKLIVDEGNVDAELHRFDATAINDFHRDYRDGVVDIYNSIVWTAYMDEVRRIEEANEEIMRQPTPSPTLAPPKMPEYPDGIRDATKEIEVDLEGVATKLQPTKTYLQRTVNIKVTYSKNAETGGEDGVQATVSTEYMYEMKDKNAVSDTLTMMVNASFKRYRGADFDYLNDDALDTAIADLVTRLKQQKSYAVAAETTVDFLENIYLIISPFNALQVKPEIPIQINPCNTVAFTAELDGIDATDPKLPNNKVNVFVTIQEDDMPYADGDSLKVTANNALAQGRFEIYSQLKLESSSFTFDDDNNKLYKDRVSTSGNELLDVTVKIYNPDNVEDGQELTEVKTTISSKK